MVIKEVKSEVADAVSAIDSKLKDSFSFLSDIKDAGGEKINKLVNDILGLAPLIEVTGFCLREFSVDASIPPGITIVFLKEKDVAPETIEQLLAENKEKEMLTLIVQGLQKADALQKGIRLSNYNFRGLSMKIGLPPDVSLKFVRKESEVLL